MVSSARLKIFIHPDGARQVRRIPLPESLKEVRKILCNWIGENSREYVKIEYKNCFNDKTIITNEEGWSEVIKDVSETLVISVTVVKNVSKTNSLSWSRIINENPSTSVFLQYFRYLTSASDDVDEEILQKILRQFDVLTILELCCEIAWLTSHNLLVLGTTSSSVASVFESTGQRSLFRPSSRCPGTIVLSSLERTGVISHTVLCPDTSVRIVAENLLKKTHLVN